MLIGSVKFKFPLNRSICSPAAPQYAPVGRTSIRSGRRGRLPATLGDQQGTSGMVVEGRGELDLGTVQTRQVTPDFFSTLAIPLLAGRQFNESDRDGAPKVCIINRTLARAAFQTDNPIGRKVGIDGVEIVGVVADVRQLAIDREPGPEYYTPWYQNSMNRRITLRIRRCRPLRIWPAEGYLRDRRGRGYVVEQRTGRGPSQPTENDKTSGV